MRCTPPPARAGCARAERKTVLIFPRTSSYSTPTLAGLARGMEAARDDDAHAAAQPRARELAAADPTLYTMYRIGEARSPCAQTRFRPDPVIIAPHLDEQLLNGILELLDLVLELRALVRRHRRGDDGARHTA